MEMMIDKTTLPPLKAPNYPAYEASESFALNRLLGNVANLELAEEDAHHLKWRDSALRTAAGPFGLPVSVLKLAHEKRIAAGDVEERGYKPPSEAEYLSREWHDSVINNPSIPAEGASSLDSVRWKAGTLFSGQLTPEKYRGLSPHWKAKIRADYKYHHQLHLREEAARAQEAAARAAGELEVATKRAAAAGLLEKAKTGLGAMSSSLAGAASGAASSAGQFARDLRDLSGLRFKAPETEGGASSSSQDLRPASFSRPSEPGTGLLGGPMGFHPQDVARAQFLSGLGMHHLPDVLKAPFHERAHLMGYILNNLQQAEEVRQAVHTDVFGILWQGLAEQNPVARSSLPELRHMFESTVGGMTNNARSVMLLRALLHMYEDYFDLSQETVERTSMQLQSGQRLLGAIENMASSASFATALTRQLVDSEQVRETPTGDIPTEELSREDMIAALRARVEQHKTDRSYQEDMMRETAAIISSGAASSSSSAPLLTELPTDRETTIPDPRLVGITPSVAAPFGNQRPDQAFAELQAMATAELEPQTRILELGSAKSVDPRRRT
jgi:hypothetical protein